MFDHPIVASGALPLIAALIGVGAVRLIAGPERGALLAGLAVGVGFLFGYHAVFGWPDVMARTAAQKIAWVAVLGLVAGIALDLSRDRERLRTFFVIIFCAAAVIWVAAPTWPRVTAAHATWGPLWALLAVVPVSIGMAPVQQRSIDGGVLVLVAALGLAIIAVPGSATSIAQTAGALAAATGGFLLWNWPVVRFPVNAALQLVGGGVFMALFAQAWLFTDISSPSLALLSLCFLARYPTARIAFGSGAFGRALGPVILGLIAAAPVAIAVLVAYLAADSGGSGYD